ncbi:MAG: hypothetical protein JJU19_09195 [Pararhodobacter sp.]|nr:hypothetical protein [Pararhodobacter sp.]
MNAISHKGQFGAVSRGAAGGASVGLATRLANTFWRRTTEGDVHKHALNARWHAAAATGISLFPRGHAVLVGTLSEQTMPLRQVATSHGADLMVMAPRHVRLDMVADCAAIMDVCVIEEASFDSVEDMVDFCLLLRQRCPDLPIVILSRSSRRDDLSLQRAPICDATLRAPVTEAALVGGLQAARQNAKIRLTRH